MDLKDTIRHRHSIRNFKEKKPPKKLIEKIIDYANLAPSAGNLQARDFIIVDDPYIKEELKTAALDQDSVAQAPLTIVVCANLDRIAPYGKRGVELYCLQDAAAAIEHILLLAVEYGLSACWIGAFNENKVSKILNLPYYIRPVAIIPIGYQNGKSPSTSRIPVKDLVHYNGW